MQLQLFLPPLGLERTQDGFRGPHRGKFFHDVGPLVLHHRQPIEANENTQFLYRDFHCLHPSDPLSGATATWGG